jgi:trimethylamine--corrinoid protein Co-methyltransferase
MNDISTIHEASMRVLSQTGVHFASNKVCEIFKQHGFRVDGHTVFFTEKEVLDALESATKEFTILARNPKHNIAMQLGTISFGMGRSAVRFVEPDGTYRSSTSVDTISAAKLSQNMDILEHFSPLFFPHDIDSVNVRLWMCKTMIEYTDKPALYSSRDDIELIALSYGTTPQQMADRTNLDISYGHTTGMVTSPLSFTWDDCENIMSYAYHGIAFHTASIPIAGTSGPCTLAGLVVQQNCENLAAIALSQLVRPGCPVFYGAIGGSADMLSLRPRFGSAEALLIERAGVQMAHSYGLLCRGEAGMTDAPCSEFQAGAQGMLSTLSALQEGANLIPACGLLGSYIGASLAKVILDEELIIQARYFLSSLKTDETSLAVDVIHEVGPGGQFVDHMHTLQNFRKDLFTESLFHSPTYDTWSASGKKNAIHLAHEKAIQLIENYQKPPLDQGIQEEIDAYVDEHWQ